MLAVLLTLLLDAGSADWKPIQKVTHPVYPLTAELPEGWTAEAQHAPIYPADTWMLQPASGGGRGPFVHVIVGWLPRGGRQSAFFPGGRLGSGRPGTLVVAGRQVPCLVEADSRLADFDVGSLALSVRALARTEHDRDLIDQVLAHMTIDESVQPPRETAEKRRALDLAADYARRRKLAGVNIVYTGPGPLPGTYRLTIFYNRGLLAVVVDPRAGTVKEEPL